MKIVYEPHPITSERKLELRSKGFKILDIAFKNGDGVTQGSVDVVVKQEPEKPKRFIKPKAE